MTTNHPDSVKTMAAAIAPPQSDDEYELMQDGTWRRRAMQDMSVFIPRVFGHSRDAIRELIRLRFDQEGLGIVGRVDFAPMREGASLAAFVHFLQWHDTPAVTAFQAHLRQCSAESLDPESEQLSRVAPARMAAHTEVEGMPVGIPGTYWLLLENKSKSSPALPLPPPAPEEDQALDEEVSIGQLMDENDVLQTALADLQERVVLQSKRIRDLEGEKDADAAMWKPVLKALQLSRRAFPKGTDLREKAAGEAARRHHRLDLLEKGVDMDVQAEANRADAAVSAMKRMEKYADEDAKLWEQVFEALNMSKDAFPVDADMRARAVYLVQSQATRLAALQSVEYTEPSSDEQRANELETYRRQVATANAMEASARAEVQALRERNQKLVEEGDEAVAQWRAKAEASAKAEKMAQKDLARAHKIQEQLERRNHQLVLEGERAVAWWRAKVLEEQHARTDAESDARESRDELGRYQRETRALTTAACAKRLTSALQRSLDEINTDILQTPDAPDDTWKFAYAKLRVALPQAVRTELVRMEEQEQEPAAPATPAATVREHMAPPRAPLKRARTQPSMMSEEEVKELREAWTREGLEGPIGDDHDADMAEMSKRTVRFADEVLVDARGPVVVDRQ